MTTQRGLQICAYVQRQKQTKEKRTLRITEKKYTVLKTKAIGGLKIPGVSNSNSAFCKR